MLRRIILVLSILIALLIAAAVIAVLVIDPNDYRDELAARASDQLGREVRLDGPIELAFFPWLALDIHDVSVGNPPGFEPAAPLAAIERARASVRVMPLLRGQIEVGTVTIERAALNLITAGDDSSNLDGLFSPADQPAARDEPADLSALRTGTLRFEDVTLNLVNLAADTRTELQLDRMEVGAFAAGQRVPLSLAGRLVEDGQAVFSLELQSDLEIAADLSRLRLADFQLDYKLPDAGAEGRAGGSLDVDLSTDPVRIGIDALTGRLQAGDLMAELSARQPVTVVLGEPVRADLPAARLTLNGQPLDLAGKATLGEIVGGELTVTGQRLDLTALAPAGGATGRKPDAAPTPAGAEPADFGALAMFDLAFSLDLDELVLAEGALLTEVSARSQLRAGQLVLDPLTARLFGGKFDGSARVDFGQRPPEVVVSPRLSGIHVAELVAVLTGKSPVDGEGAFEMNLRFRGFSPQQILSSLDGAGSFAMDEGVLQGVDLQALIDQELTSDNLGNIARAFGGETHFRTLSGTLRIEDGVVKLPSLDLLAAGYGATGQGQIDLAAGRVDYALALDLGEELTQKLPRVLRRSTGGQIPLSISGDLTRPTVRVDLAALAEGAVRQELGRRLLEALEDDEEEEDDSAPPGEGEPAGSQAEGEADAAEDETETETDERDQRRAAARSLLRGLLESREDEPPAEESEESTEEESDPPPSVD